jgi:lycopene cyclase domain-containing protein
MSYEYLLFNLLVLSGPVIFSFDRTVRFFRYWRPAAMAILLISPLFILWDAYVTGRHWWFNRLYTTGPAPLGLPIGEWLFFFTVPFACLFIWQIFRHHQPQTQPSARRPFLLSALTVFVSAGVALVFDKEYTAMSLSIFAAALLLGVRWHLFDRPFWRRYALILFGLMLLCNGYLTARPVVLYDETYILGIRVLTIPIEDFFYGYALVMLICLVYETMVNRYE